MRPGATRPRFEDYPFQLRPLAADEGVGYVITFPDLPGCLSDGATPEEALIKGRGAFAAWVAAYEAEGREIPRPFATSSLSGRFVQRVPRSLHAQLVLTAAREGVSVNALVAGLIARGLAGSPGR